MNIKSDLLEVIDILENIKLAFVPSARVQQEKALDILRKIVIVSSDPKTYKKTTNTCNTCKYTFHQIRVYNGVDEGEISCPKCKNLMHWKVV